MESHDNTERQERPGLCHELNYNHERDRLQTFFPSWTVRFIQPEELARWGFFYTGHHDRVQCHFCHIVLGEWDEHDAVIEEHLKWSPDCRLMTKRPTDNVPVDANFLDQLDTAGTGIAIHLGTAASRYRGPCNRYQPTSSNDNPEWHRQRVLNGSAPDYEPTIPHYEIGDNRLASFQEWPKCMKQTPEQMADAGFCYTGKSDVVICFCCGGQLWDWLPEHNPWVEHARNFSGCPYLKLVKTPGFIAECQAKWYTNDVLIGRPEYPGHDVTKRKEQYDVADENCCKICYTRPFDTVFIPCGHVVACGRCAASTLNCPVCNKWYTSVQRIFFT